MNIIELISRQINMIEGLRSMSSSAPEFKAWKIKTKALLAKAFPQSPDHAEDFIKIFNSYQFISNYSADNSHKYYIKNLEEARAILQSMVELIEEFNVDTERNTVHSGKAQYVYVDQDRIDELMNLKSNDFDMKRLIQICNELNIANTNDMYLTTLMLVRSLLDHIPPIFGKASFKEVASQHGQQSFKELMSSLNVNLRKLADSCLHGHIRKKENLPNATQINFTQPLDALLAEIVRHTVETNMIIRNSYT